jgi:tetratricopeptide (TPR) repeat protein
MSAVREQHESIEYLDVLVLYSAPVDVRPTLNLAQEMANFEHEVRRSPIPIRLRRVFPPTVEQLERELSPNALRLRRPRVFHFLGHGEEDGLWFETEFGGGDLVSTSRLRKLFKGGPIELAVVNACWSATSRLQSLCDYLTRDSAVRTAIGHGTPVDDRSAITFAQGFYGNLTRGLPVGRACQAAANGLSASGLPGAFEVKLSGDAAQRLGHDLIPGERTGRVEDGMPRRGYLPGGSFFCGRAEEYLAISQSLADVNQRVFGLWGMGGIGKTALALEVARRNAWRYIDGGAVWVDARDVAPPSALGLVARALVLLTESARAADPVSGLVRHLQAASGLIVLDNLETLPESELEPLGRFLRQIPRNGSRVLLTARSRLAPIEALPDSRSRLLTTGLDDWNGAHYAYRVAQAKNVEALQVTPRDEMGKVVGPCSQVSQRLSGHPKMIEIAVPLARTGLGPLEEVLSNLRGDLETQLDDLLSTGLALLGAEGRRLLAYLPLFPTGRFMPEALSIACAATQRTEPTEPEEGSRLPSDVSLSWVQVGLRQLEYAAFLQFDPDAKVYSFHQLLLDRVSRESGLHGEDRANALIELLLFYAGYLEDNKENYSSLDRCFDNALVLMESLWQERTEAGPIDGALVFMADVLSHYLEARGRWQAGDCWSERAVELRRTSPSAKNDEALAHALYFRARLLLNRGDPTGARAALYESMEIMSSRGNQQAQGALLYQLADLEWQRGNLDEARRLLERSSTIAGEVCDQQGLSASLQLWAMIESAQGAPDEARRLLQRSMEIAVDQKDERGLSASLHELAIIESAQGNPGEARDLLQRSIAIKENLGVDQQGLGASLYQLSLIEFSQGNPTEARRLLQRSMAIDEALDDQMSLAASLHQLAILEWAQSNPTEARHLLQRSVELSESLGDQRGMAASLHQLAMIETDQGNLAEARRLLQRSMAISEAVGDQRMIAGSLHQLAMIETAQSNPDGARRLLQRSMGISEAMGNQHALAASLHQLAHIEWWAEGNPTESRGLLQRSMRILEATGDQRSLAASLHLLATIESAQGNDAEAIRLLSRSTAIAEELGDKRVLAASLHHLATIKSALGNLDESLQLLRQSMSIKEALGDQQGVAASLHQLAMIASARGEPAEARSRLQRSLDISEQLGDRLSLAVALHDMGIIEWGHGNLSEARRLWTRSLDANQGLCAHNRASTLLMLAQQDAGEGALEQGLTQAREAVRLFEKIGSAKAEQARQILSGIEDLAKGV